MTPVLDVKDNMLVLKCRYEDREYAKSIPGYRWNAKEKCWQYPLRPEVYKKILDLLKPRVTINVQKAIAEIIQRENEANQLKTQGWEKTTPIEPIPIRSKPYNHQVLAYNIGIKLPCIALFMEQGTGKTLAAIAIAGRRFKRGEIKKVLVVAPSSVTLVWRDEFIKHADFPYELEVLEGPVQRRIEIITSWPNNPDVLQVAVINYEATWRMEKELLTWRPDMVICDESQRIKSPSAKQSKTMHKFAQVAKYRLALSGTPITQGLIDIYSQYKFLEPSIFGTSFYAFRNRYCIMGGYENYQIIGYKNVDELTRKMHSIAFRVTKAEALDLPEQVDQVQYCELEPYARDIYEDIRNLNLAELINEERVTVTNVLTRLLRLSQVCGGFMKDDSGTLQQVSSAKLTLLAELLSDLSPSKKIVIFARFLPEIESIKQLLEKMKISYVWITGEVEPQKRSHAVWQFQNNNECRAFVAQIATGGLGITLTASDLAIFYSLDFSYANYDQCKARIHRLGQRNTCTYIHLIARDTVDEKILNTLQRKKNVAEDVVDNWRQYFERRGEGRK